MNRYYSETDFGNLIKSIEFNICMILLKCFVEFLSIIHYLCNEQTLLFITNMFGNQKWSVVSAHVLMIDGLKMNTCVKPSYLGLGYITPTKHLMPNFS